MTATANGDAPSMPECWVGSTPVDLIAAAIVHTAQIRRMKPEDLTTLDDKGWRDLVGASFGAGVASVRLAVIMRLCHEERCS